MGRNTLEQLTLFNLEDHINRFCNITKESMKQAEQILKLKCPMDNDFKIGKTWAETH